MSMSIINKWLKLDLRKRALWFLAVLYFLTLPLAQLGRVELNLAVFYLSDFVILFWLVFGLVEVKLFLQNFYRWFIQHPLLIFFTIWTALGLVLGSFFEPSNLRPWLIIARAIGYFIFAGSLSIFFDKYSVSQRWAVVAGGLGFVWLGFLQYFLYPDMRQFFSLGWDDHYFRMIGSMLDPNFLGIIMVITLTGLLSLQLRAPKWILHSLVLITLVAIILTYSRASYLSLIFVLAGFFIFPQINQAWKGWLLSSFFILTILSASILTFVMAPKPGGEGVNLQRSSSIDARVNSSKNYLSENTQSWQLFFGSGLFFSNQNSISSMTNVENNSSPFFFEANSSTPNHAQAPDSLFLTLLLGTGIIGLVAGIASLILLLKYSAQRDSFSALAFAAVLIHAQFNNTLMEPFVFQFLMLFLLKPLSPVDLLKPHRSAFRKKQ